MAKYVFYEIQNKDSAKSTFLTCGLMTMATACWTLTIKELRAQGRQLILLHSMSYFLSYSLSTEHPLNTAILWCVQLCRHSLPPQLRFCSIFCFLLLFHSLPWEWNSLPFFFPWKVCLMSLLPGLFLPKSTCVRGERFMCTEETTIMNIRPGNSLCGRANRGPWKKNWLWFYWTLKIWKELLVMCMVPSQHTLCESEEWCTVPTCEANLVG